MRIYNNVLRKEIENYLNVNFGNLNIIQVKKIPNTFLNQSEQIKILCRSNNNIVDMIIIDNKIKVITLLQKNGEDHQYILESEFGRFYCVKKVLFKFEKNYINFLKADYSNGTLVTSNYRINDKNSTLIDNETLVLIKMLGDNYKENN